VSFFIQITYIPERSLVVRVRGRCTRGFLSGRDKKIGASGFDKPCVEAISLLAALPKVVKAEYSIKKKKLMYRRAEDFFV